MPQLIQHVNFLAVQWFSSEEWKRVFNLIFEHNGDILYRKEALQILLVWKARCPALPSAIESTLGLLEVELQDAIDTRESDANNRLLRLMYSSVIMRFINHTLDDSQSKRLSLLQAASQMKIPQWIVNLRHETAHGHDLPSLSILKNASEFALNWLYTVYWSPYNATISDVLTKENTLRSQFESDINEMISLHNLLAVLSHPSFNIVKLSDIGDVEMKDSIISDLKTKNVDAKTKITPKMKIKTAVRCVVKNIKVMLINSNRSCQKDEIFAKIMVGSESLFLTSSSEITGDLNKHNKFSKEFTHVWEPLLTLLHSQDIISALVRELIGIVENNEEPQQKRIRSAQWVAEIAAALLKSKLMMNLPRPSPKNGTAKKRQLFCSLLERYPKQKHGLTFSLTHPVPQNISNPEFTNQLFENYTPYLDIYLSRMLELREPALPHTTMQKSLELIRIMSSKQINVTCERIYSLYDLTHENDVSVEQSEIASSAGNVSKSNVELDQSVEMGTVDSHIGLGKWHRASSEFDWGKCPIGVLPWQMNTFSNNTLLP